MAALYLYVGILLVSLGTLVAAVGYQKWMSAFRTAKQLLETWRTLEVVVPPSKSPGETVDIGSFDKMVNNFLLLGFQRVDDYWLYVKTRGPLGTLGPRIKFKTAPPPPLASPTPTSVGALQPYKPYRLLFCRVLVHPQHNCQVIVMLSGAVGYNIVESKPKFGFLKEQKSTVSARITSRNQAWQYTTFPGVPEFGYLWRRPDELFTYCRGVNSDTAPKVSCAMLLDFHLKRRSEIARAGGFEWGSPSAISELTDGEIAKAAYIREWAQRHSTLQLTFLLWQLKRQSVREWLGELQGKL